MTHFVNRLYSCPPEPSTDDVTLLDDIYAVRGKPKHQVTTLTRTFFFFQRFLSCLKTHAWKVHVHACLRKADGDKNERIELAVSLT